MPVLALSHTRIISSIFEETAAFNQSVFEKNERMLTKAFGFEVPTTKKKKRKKIYKQAEKRCKRN